MFGQFIFACPTFAATPPVPRRDPNWRDVCKNDDDFTKQAADATPWDKQVFAVDSWDDLETDTTPWDKQGEDTTPWDQQGKDELTNRKCGYKPKSCSGGR